MSEKVMCGNSTVDTGSDHRAPVSTLKIASHDFLKSTEVQSRIMSQGNLFYFAKLQGKKWIGSSSKQ